MGRTRSLKPGFFQNEHLAECSMAARLLFAGLWTIADRNGRLEYRPKRIGVALFPYDPGVDAAKLIHELASHGLVTYYISGGNHYLDIPKFKDHQTPHHREPAACPEPESVLSPEQFGQCPESSGQCPEQFRQSPEQFGQCPESSGQSPESFGHHVLPEKNSNSGQSPESFGQSPEQFGQCPESSGQCPPLIPSTSNLIPSTFVATSETTEDRGRRSLPPSVKISWNPTEGWAGITAKDRAGWAEAYPAVNLDRALAAMTEWLRANPAKARKSNWRAFVTRWLTKEQDRGGDAQSNRPGATVTPKENRRYFRSDAHKSLTDAEYEAWKAEQGSQRQITQGRTNGRQNGSTGPTGAGGKTSRVSEFGRELAESLTEEF